MIRTLLEYLADQFRQAFPEWLVYFGEREASSAVGQVDRCWLELRVLEAVRGDTEPLTASPQGWTDSFVVVEFTAGAPKAAGVALGAYDALYDAYRFFAVSQGMRRAGAVYITHDGAGGIAYEETGQGLIGQWQQRYHIRHTRG